MPTVTQQDDLHRFIIEVDQGFAGKAVYHDRGKRRIFVHTEIADAFEGQGLASQLVRAALDATRDEGRPVVPLCPYVAGWIDKHPDYADLVDHEFMARLVN